MKGSNPITKQPGNPLPCFPLAMPDVNEMLAFIIFVINIFPFSLGTLISAFVDRQGVNIWAIIVWILQLITNVYLLFGWFWGIYHGYCIWKGSL